MESLTLAFGIAGIAGAVVSTVVAAAPPALERYYDWKNRPLKVTVVRAFTKVNPAAGGRVMFRIENRLRSAVPIQVSPMTGVEVLNEAGIVSVRGKLFENPTVRLYPSNKEGGFESIPGHDSRELVLELPVRQGVLEGTEEVQPVVFANRFRVQEIRLGPFHFEVSPKFT